MKKDKIKSLLPEVIQDVVTEHSLFDGFLSAMEALHQPLEDVNEKLELFINPLNTSSAFVPYLAHCLNLEMIVDEDIPEENARKIIANSMNLYPRRGSKEGIKVLLENAMGIKGVIIEEDIEVKGEVVPFHVRIKLPETVRSKIRLIKKLIEWMQPVYVTYELDFYSLKQF